MAANSKIEWTDHTWNPWRGCEHATLPDGSAHPGCANCYAEAMSKRNPSALGAWGGSQEGIRVAGVDSYWKTPFKWNREAAIEQEAHLGRDRRPRVFCASLADIFEDWGAPIVDPMGRVLYVHDCEPHPEPHRYVPMPTEGPSGLLPGERENLDAGMYRLLTMADLRQRVFDTIDATPNLDWLILTKRPENVQRMWPSFTTGGKQPTVDAIYRGITVRRDNVWLLTSVSDQATADAMIPSLLECRDLVPVLGLSMEPLVGPVSLTINRGICDGSETGGPPGCGEPIRRDVLSGWETCGCCDEGCEPVGPNIDWVIVGGESGPGARPMHPQWARSLRDQCEDAGVPYFFKQWGEWQPQLESASPIVCSGDLTRLRAIGIDGQDGNRSNGPYALMAKLGKKEAGRTLDGREWNQFPEVQR